MRILVTGHYEPDYNRIMVLLEGLKKHGIDLIEFPYEKRNRKIQKKIVELSRDCDLIFLPSFTHPDVPFIKKSVLKPVVFDPLISRYLTKVFDRKSVWRFSPRAYKNYLKDQRAFRYSDLIIADTQSHKDYYCSHFTVDPAKITVVPIGVNTEDFFPLKEEVKSDDTIIVGFYGSFIPLHGIDRIVLAANILKEKKNIKFEIYGNGSLFHKISDILNKMQLSALELKGYVDYYNLNQVLNKMDICLGIFGESLKTELVIPNKVYHYAACRKAIITKDTNAIREVFSQDENIVLSSNDPEDIASKIIHLAEHPDFRRKVAANAYSLISNDFNEVEVTRKLLQSFKDILHS